MLGWELPPHITGGLGVACEGLLRGLHALGETSVTFVASTLPGGESEVSARIIAMDRFPLANESPLTARIDVAESGLHAAPARSITGATGAYNGSSVLPALTYAARLPALLRHVPEIDVIHAHDWLTLPAAGRAKRVTQRPLAVHMHSTEIERAGGRAHPEIVAIERDGLASADAVVAVSEATRRVLVSHYGVSPAKVMVIHNAADHMPWTRPAPRVVKDDPVVTFVGRLTQQKGPRHFIEAASRVLRQFPEARFVMAGDGDQMQMARTLVIAKGLAPQFRFLGFLDAAGVRSCLTQSDLYVMPSIAEPFGIGALEAIHCGVPVVISAPCGVNESVFALTRVQAGDSAALAEAIIRLLNDPCGAYQQALCAQIEARHLTWCRAAEAVLTVYRAICAEAYRASNDLVAAVSA